MQEIALAMALDVAWRMLAIFITAMAGAYVGCLLFREEIEREIREEKENDRLENEA